MAFLSGKNNNFKFEFPKYFVPDEIDKKYSPLLNRIPGNMCTTVVDFINYSIMSVEIEVNPGEYDPIEQRDRGTPFRRLSRSGFYPDYLFAKNITITFQLDSAYLIWSIMVDLFYYYYCWDKKDDEKYIPQLPGMEILDSYNKVLYRISFFNLLYTGISGLEFNFSSNGIEQKTITTNWVANEILMDFEPSHV